MNEMTGFGPEDLKKQIASFLEKGKLIHDNLAKAMWEFYDNLYKSWFSPKAKEFEQHLYDLGRVIYNLNISYEKTASAMIDAFNAHATANGTGTLANEYEGAEYQPDGANFGDMHLEEVSPEGKVGMVTETVIQATIDLITTVRKQLDAVKESYDLPAFYDPEGNQIEAYVSLVNKMRDKVEEELGTVVQNIGTALDEEEKIVKEAAQSATAALTQ